MLKKLSLVVGAALLLAACGASTSEESEAVGTVEGAVTGLVCSGSEGCGNDAHPASVFCDTSCSPYVCGGSVTRNATMCVLNAGVPSYWQCTTACDVGYHRTGLKCDPSNCGPDNCTNPSYWNMAECAPNTDDFWQCAGNTTQGYCPAGYNAVGTVCDPSSSCGSCDYYPNGKNLRHCVKA